MTSWPATSCSARPTAPSSSTGSDHWWLFIYSASAAVAVDSSHMTASSSASWSKLSPVVHLQILIIGTCGQSGSWSVADHNHTHTHAYNSPFSGTTRVNQYQKGKTNLDFTEAIDSQWQWHQLGNMQVCTSLQTDNHTSTSCISRALLLLNTG